MSELKSLLRPRSSAESWLEHVRDKSRSATRPRALVFTDFASLEQAWLATFPQHAKGARGDRGGE